MRRGENLKTPLGQALYKAFSYALPMVCLTLLAQIEGAFNRGEATVTKTGTGRIVLCLFLFHGLACLPLFIFRQLEKRASGKLRASPVDHQVKNQEGFFSRSGRYAGTGKADFTRESAVRSWLQPVCALVGGFFFYFICSRLNSSSPLLQILLFSIGLFLGFFLILRLQMELLLYLLFGALTAVVSIGSFSLVSLLLESIFKQSAEASLLWLIPQSISFLAAVTFAFFTNRKWVFRSTGHPLKEFLAFIFNRFLSSLVFEYGGLYLLVNLVRMQADLAKILTALLVVLVNYFISKYLIFRQKVECREGVVDDENRTDS